MKQKLHPQKMKMVIVQVSLTRRWESKSNDDDDTRSPVDLDKQRIVKIADLIGIPSRLMALGGLCFLETLTQASKTANLFSGAWKWHDDRYEAPRERAPKLTWRQLHPRMRPRRAPKQAANWHRTRAQTTRAHMPCGRIDWE